MKETQSVAVEAHFADEDKEVPGAKEPAPSMHQAEPGSCKTTKLLSRRYQPIVCPCKLHPSFLFILHIENLLLMNLPLLPILFPTWFLITTVYPLVSGTHIRKTTLCYNLVLSPVACSWLDGSIQTLPKSLLKRSIESISSGDIAVVSCPHITVWPHTCVHVGDANWTEKRKKNGLRNLHNKREKNMKL